MSEYETSIESDPDVPLVRITREFDAPPAKVFRAHIDPDLFVQWVGPGAHAVKIDHWECRNGGSYRYVITNHDAAYGCSEVRDAEPAGIEYAFRGCFHEVREGELIVQTFSFEGVPDGIALEKLLFEELGDGRTRLVATALVDSFEGRDAFVASGMEGGVQDGYRKLDALLAG
jgi:uncharacterized protein YndB with AHSA1/START domain